MTFFNIFINNKNKLFNLAKLVTLVSCILIISACELLPQHKTISPTYGDYYLWLKTLNHDDLLQEIEQQSKNQAASNPDADIYVMLLHSLPNSPIYSPYKAKSMLNELQLQNVESRYNPTNLALITLLKDLLNEQLLIAQKNSNLSVDYRNANKTILTLGSQIKEKEQQLAVKDEETVELKKQVALLKEQINQLHRIEKNISQHGN